MSCATKPMPIFNLGLAPNFCLFLAFSYKCLVQQDLWRIINLGLVQVFATIQHFPEYAFYNKTYDQFLIKDLLGNFRKF
jgi:hypothetical protein